MLSRETLRSAAGRTLTRPRSCRRKNRVARRSQSASARIVLIELTQIADIKARIICLHTVLQLQETKDSINLLCLGDDAVVAKGIGKTQG